MAFRGSPLISEQYSAMGEYIRVNTALTNIDIII